MTLANTLDYYDAATITTVKRFMVKAPVADVIKLFTAVSYDFS
jgi:hypothetical protein